MTLEQNTPAVPPTAPAKVKKAPSFQRHPTHKELYAMGKLLRDTCPRESHAAWTPAPDRPDPVALVEQSNEGRIAELVPIRHGRMLQTPFTFFRGAALNMAADLAKTPSTGLRVQVCGDCHLHNFGSYATPERRVIFDINDMDETLPAPWEWDVKRLATSFILACRDNGFTADCAREAALSCVRSYREHMAEYSEMTVLDVWYSSVDAKKVMATVDDEGARKRYAKRVAKARERSVLEHEFPELVTTDDVVPKIRDNPPLIYHFADLHGNEAVRANIEGAFARYRATMQEDRRVLLDRYQLVDFALKVVGVGSVGTYCGVLLLMASENDPLFLQVKQARPSVLAAYAGGGTHVNDGQRVVHGHRLMQSASDIFLGWTEGEAGRHFYVRQLKDMKIKPLVESFAPTLMATYGRFCGWVLARAHARSGSPAKISGYLGKSDKFDEAIADFSIAYADQTERDYAVLRKAARAGRLKVKVERERE